MLQLLPPALRLHFEASADTDTISGLLVINLSALRDNIWLWSPMLEKDPSARSRNA